MSSKYAKGIVKSTWTPLNHEDSNLKVFEERRLLVNKWFEMWNTNQRKLILEDLLMACTGNQVEYAKIILNTKAVQNHVDFTRMLPRVISLYIFSFLDPRSLCRVSQTCWYWKHLTEANEIWAPKCARLGWYFSGPLNSMETGLWKKHFIDNIIDLQITRPAKDLTALEIARQAEKENEMRKARKLRDKQLMAQRNLGTPWRGPDPKPIDIVRNNYIENDIEHGARVKTINPKANPKSRRIIIHDNSLNGKAHSVSSRRLSLSKPDDVVPVSPGSSRLDIELSKQNSGHPVIEYVPRPSPMRSLVDSGRPRSCNVLVNADHVPAKPVDDQASTNPVNMPTTPCSDIPSGRPWVLATDNEE